MIRKKVVSLKHINEITYIMESVFIIIIIFLLVIYLFAQSSDKETKREKYGDAVGTLAHSAADTVAGLAQSITEPSDKKAIRKAKEKLSERNGNLYRFDLTHTRSHINRLLTVDENFKASLDVLGLSVERWKKVGLHLLYVGCIRFFSRDQQDFTKKNSDSYRFKIINNWEDDPTFKPFSDILKEALSFFHISEEEWIKYGDTVIEMYNVNDKKDIKQFGIINQILPMKNNRHLL